MTLPSTLPPCLLCGTPSAQAVLCNACLHHRPGEALLPFVPPGWRVINIEGADVWFGPSARPFGVTNANA